MPCSPRGFPWLLRAAPSRSGMWARLAPVPRSLSLSGRAGELVSALSSVPTGACMARRAVRGGGRGSCPKGGVTGEARRPGGHTAAVCLMLWKLIRVGDVGMDMARATGTRRE